MDPRTRKLYSENNDFQHLEVLKRNREKRARYREFFVEGVRSIDRALANGWEIKAFAYSSQRKLSSWADRMLDDARVPLRYDLPLALMEKLSEKDETSELIAVIAMPLDDLGRIEIDRDLLAVVIDRPSSHGNLGTIIRSCDSFGVDGVILVGHGVDPYDPQTIRASAGSFFSVPVIKVGSHSELMSWFDGVRRECGDFRIIGTSAKAGRRLADHDLCGPLALLLGNEAGGLSVKLKAACDSQAGIPIRGSATSLNVACAASICLYEIARQRGFA